MKNVEKALDGHQDSVLYIHEKRNWRTLNVSGKCYSLIAKYKRIKVVITFYGQSVRSV